MKQIGKQKSEAVLISVQLKTFLSIEKHIRTLLFFFQLKPVFIKYVYYNSFLTFHVATLSDSKSILMSPFSSLRKSPPSGFSWILNGQCTRYKSTKSNCKSLSDFLKNLSTQLGRFPVGGSLVVMKSSSLFTFPESIQDFRTRPITCSFR